MASFFRDLWESVFAPGPTPALLVATNSTFAALQLILAVLFASTRSIHFAILSVLCSGLWWAINWFARELRAHQAHEQAKEKEKMVPVGQGTAATEDEADESETEVEGGSVGVSGLASSGMSSVADVPDLVFTPASPDQDAAKGKALEREEEISASAETVMTVKAAAAAAAAASTAAATTGLDDTDRGDLKQRPRGVANQDPQGSAASTEDEWEKVSENEGNRFK